MHGADSFTLLDFAPGAYLQEEPLGAPMPFAVWLDDEIIGAGECPSEAVADARRTVRLWESNEVR
jgi:hypothetical protein